MKKIYHLIGIIIFIFILTKIDFAKLFLDLRNIRIQYLLLLNTLAIPTLFLRSLRWNKLLQAQRINYPLKDAFLAYLGAFFAGIVTPARIGELVKAHYLKKDRGVGYSESFASIFLDRVFDISGLFLISAAGMILFFYGFKPIGIYALAIFVALSAVFLILWFRYGLFEKSGRFFYRSIFSKVDERMLKGQLKVFLSNTRMITAKPIFFTALALTIAAFGFYFLECFFLARICSINLPFLTIVIIVSLSSIASMLPVTFFGIGTRDASLIYLFSLYGLSTESAVTYSFLMFLSFYVFCGIFGFIGWVIKGSIRLNDAEA